MNWIFIVVRDGVVENCKVFTDYFEGEQFANNFIKKIDPSITDFPKYRQGEVFVKLFTDHDYFIGGRHAKFERNRSLEIALGRAKSLRIGLYKDAQI
jgi:hypothetical protein